MKRPFSLLLLPTLLALSPAVQASLALHLDEEALFAQAERIAAVVCLGPGRTWTSPDGRRLYTEFFFEVEEDFRGGGDRTVRLVQPGGRLGRVVQKTWGYPEFHAGERLVLFLRQGTGGWHTVGLSQGVFFWDPARDGRLVQRLEGLLFPSGPQPPLVLTRSRLLDNLVRYPGPGREERP